MFQRARASKRQRILRQQLKQSSKMGLDSQSMENKKRMSDSAKNGAEASKRQCTLRQQRKVASKVHVLRIAYYKLHWLEEHGGRPIPVFLNSLTANKLRCKLWDELRNFYWQNHGSLKAPWERYLSMEDRHPHYLTALQGIETDIAIMMISTKQSEFEYELKVFRIPPLKKGNAPNPHVNDRHLSSLHIFSRQTHHNDKAANNACDIFVLQFEMIKVIRSSGRANLQSICVFVCVLNS